MNNSISSFQFVLAIYLLFMKCGSSEFKKDSFKYDYSSI